MNSSQIKKYMKENNFKPINQEKERSIMSDRKFTFSIHTDQFSDLLYALHEVEKRIYEGRQLQITVDLENEKIYTTMLPVESEEFIVGFDCLEH